jgi:hypothetical protein
MTRRFARIFWTLIVISIATVTSLAQVNTVARTSPQAFTGASTQADAADAAGDRVRDKNPAVAPTGVGNPLMLPGVLYDSGGAQASSAVVADVNGDGIPDLLVSNFCVSPSSCINGTIGVLLGNGDGTFRAAVPYDSGGYLAIALAVGDVNGDGKPDLIVVNQYGNTKFADGTIGVLLGNGDGTFQPAVTYSTDGFSATAVAVADLNGDGKLDVVVTNCDVGTGNASCYTGDGVVSVLLGNGDGTFQTAATYELGQILGTAGADGVAIADINGDGIPDLVIATGSADSEDPGELVIMLGEGNGTFSIQNTYQVGLHSPASAPLVADANGDGINDLLAASDLGVSVLYGYNGSFRPAVNFGLSNAIAGSVAVADINGDGIPDLVAGTSEGPAVLFGLGNEHFQSVLIYSAGLNGSFVAAVADLNNDGKPDVVALSGENNGDGAVGVLLNNRQGPPYIATTTALGSSANPAVRKEMITYTATVTSQTGGAVTGSVTFQEVFVVDGQYAPQTIAVEPLTNNQASCSVSYTKAGWHLIIAAYSGDAANNYSTSSELYEYAGAVPVGTRTRVRSSESHSVYGHAVTFAAKVTWAGGTVPNGESVTFYNGTNAIGTGTTSGGIATFTTSLLPAGKLTIGASYSGDSNFKPSQGKIIQIVSASPVPSKTVLATSGSPSVVGQPVTFTATVTSEYGAIPNGELVTFYDGVAEIGTGTTTGGVATFTTSSLTAKTHTIKSTYGGDGTFKSSTGKVTQMVNQ